MSPYDGLACLWRGRQTDDELETWWHLSSAPTTTTTRPLFLATAPLRGPVEHPPQGRYLSFREKARRIGSLAVDGSGRWTLALLRSARSPWWLWEQIAEPARASYRRALEPMTTAPVAVDSRLLLLAHTLRNESSHFVQMIATRRQPRTANVIMSASALSHAIERDSPLKDRSRRAWEKLRPFLDVSIRTIDALLLRHLAEFTAPIFSDLSVIESHLMDDGYPDHLTDLREAISALSSAHDILGYAHSAICRRLFVRLSETCRRTAREGDASSVLTALTVMALDPLLPNTLWPIHSSWRACFLDISDRLVSSSELQRELQNILRRSPRSLLLSVVGGAREFVERCQRSGVALDVNAFRALALLQVLGEMCASSPPLVSEENYYCVSLSLSSVSSQTFTLAWLPTWTAATEASRVSNGTWPFSAFPRAVSFPTKLLLLRAESARRMCDAQRVAYVAVQQILDMEHTYHQRAPHVTAPTPFMEFDPLSVAPRVSRDGEPPRAEGRFAALRQVEMPRYEEDEEENQLVVHGVPFDITSSYSATIFASDFDPSSSHGQEYHNPLHDMQAEQVSVQSRDTDASDEQSAPPSSSVNVSSLSRDSAFSSASSASSAMTPVVSRAVVRRDDGHLSASVVGGVTPRQPITSRFTNLHDELILLRRLGPSVFHYGNVYLVFELSRDRLLDDIFAQLSAKDVCVWKPLKVRMSGVTGEDGLDRGGVQKEVIARAVALLFEEERGLFETDEISLLCWFKENVDETHMRLAGELIALCLYNGLVVNLPFPALLYSLLASRDVMPVFDVPLSVDDISPLWPLLSRGLGDLLEYSGDVAGDIGVSFDDAVSDVVTKENRSQYVERFLYEKTYGRVMKQVKAFHDGFMRVVGPLKTIEMFSATELQRALCGDLALLDFDALEQNTTYDDGFSSDHPFIRLFWEVVNGFTEDEKRSLLLFVTACGRAPPTGMSAITFVIQRNGPDSDRLPSSQTCFGRLLLPQYYSKEKLREKLLAAIQHHQGFGLV